MTAIIAARSRNNVIGRNGMIPWRIKGEQKQFRELTTGNVVIMGRRSYEEIGHPLPDRMNIIVSGTIVLDGENIVSARSLGEALEKAEKYAPGRDIYIAGGYGLFREALPIADKLFLTEVDIVVDDGDTFFPEFDRDDFILTVGETVEGDISYTRTCYTRKR